MSAPDSPSECHLRRWPLLWNRVRIPLRRMSNTSQGLLPIFEIGLPCILLVAREKLGKQTADKISFDCLRFGFWLDLSPPATLDQAIDFEKHMQSHIENGGINQKRPSTKKTLNALILLVGRQGLEPGTS